MIELSHHQLSALIAAAALAVGATFALIGHFERQRKVREMSKDPVTVMEQERGQDR